MNNTAPATVALQVLPKLIALIEARKQARWHWKYGANEHKHSWTLVLAHQDTRIKAMERYIGDNLDIKGFRAKKEIIE